MPTETKPARMTDEHRAIIEKQANRGVAMGIPQAQDLTVCLAEIDALKAELAARDAELVEANRLAKEWFHGMDQAARIGSGWLDRAQKAEAELAEARKALQQYGDALVSVVGSGCIGGIDHPIDICKCWACRMRRLAQNWLAGHSAANVARPIPVTPGETIVYKGEL